MSTKLRISVTVFRRPPESLVLTQDSLVLSCVRFDKAMHGLALMV